MIKELFLPITLGKKRILSQRIIGYSLDETRASAAATWATSGKTNIEAFYSVELENGDASNYKERSVVALKELARKIGRHEHVRIAIPASIVVLKELKVPFLDYDKIKMIIEYEVEAMLPFSIEEAVVDFIVTETFKDEGSSQILVAAVRIQDLQSIIEIYTEAGIKAEDITIDLFALYGLYQQIPEYKKITQATALIDVGTRTTRIAFLYHGELRFMRTIQKGIAFLAQLIADDVKKPVGEVLAHLHSQGLIKTNDAAFDQAIEKHLINFFHEIQFTINSFSLKLNYYENMNKILFTGLIDLFPDFIEFAATVLQTPCELFAGEKLLSSGNIKNKIPVSIESWNPYLIALGTAVTYPDHYEFNLRKKIFAQADYELASRQILTAATLLILLFGAIVAHGYLQIATLSATAKQIEKREIEKLKPLFADNMKLLTGKTNFKKIITEAERSLSEKQAAWAQFSHATLEPVGIIYELMRIVDRRHNGVTLNSLTISTDDTGQQIIEVSGLFKSKTGHDDFSNFYEWQKGFQDSLVLELVERIDEQSADDNSGVNFNAKLRLKKQ
jgi:Tfp pilus assembly PilM family ATPase